VNPIGFEVVTVPFDGEVVVGSVDDVVTVEASVVGAAEVVSEVVSEVASEVVSKEVVGSAVLDVGVALVVGVSEGGGMTLKLTVAPQSARGVPFRQQPAFVQ